MIVKIAALIISLIPLVYITLFAWWVAEKRAERLNKHWLWLKNNEREIGWN